MRNQTENTFREAILKELRRRGITPYAVSKRQRAVHPGTVREFLYCDGKEVMAKTIEALVRELDLTVVSGHEVRLLRRLASTLRTSRARKPHVVREILKELEGAGLPA